VDSNGTIVWEKTYGGTRFDAAEGIHATKDGGFVISGNSKSDDQDLTGNAGENDLWLLKIDEFGNVLWQQSFGGSDLEYGFDAIQTSDGALIMAGESKSTDFSDLQSKGLTDVVLLKVE
jgi:hypothetical protein